MDSRTHVELARKLLAISRGPISMTVASLFPQIDRNPPTLHRLYAHQIVKARDIAEWGLSQVLGLTYFTPRNWPFAQRRFSAEKGRMLSYLTIEEQNLASNPPPAELLDQAMMAFTSHLYLDAYNQPTQIFVPYSVQCSGQWALWEKLGDFRESLYLTSRITDLRQGLFEDSFWAKPPHFSAPCLIEAMLLRMVSMGQGLIASDVVNRSLESLKIDETGRTSVRQAVTFLSEFESLLVKYHDKVFEPTKTRYMPLSLDELLVKN